MTADNKHIVTNNIVRIRQLFFSHVTVTSSHASTNLPNRHFLQEIFLISKYSSIFHALLHSQSHVPGF